MVSCRLRLETMPTTLQGRCHVSRTNNYWQPPLKHATNIINPSHAKNGATYFPSTSTNKEGASIALPAASLQKSNDLAEAHKPKAFAGGKGAPLINLNDIKSAIGIWRGNCLSGSQQGIWLDYPRTTSIPTTSHLLDLHPVPSDAGRAREPASRWG